jgi:hypothetical protein
MFRAALILSRRLLVPLSLVGFALPADAAVEVGKTYGKLPLHFEVNQGQTHENVRFLARGSGYSLYLTSGEAVFVLAKPNPDKKRHWHGKRDWRSKHERLKAQEVLVLRMAVVGAHPAPLVSGLEELPGKVNYFVGSDPARWRTNVPTYAKVHYREVYPGIDLVYYGNQRQLEYDFVVAPGADQRSIVLDFQGADRLEVNADGELVLHLAGGVLRQRKPVIYQEVNGIRREVAGGYVLQGANRVGFHVAAYDRSRPLVIDPVLAYSTYLGGGDRFFEHGHGIAVDSAGNAYVTGTTGSANFPTTPGAFQPTFNGVSDAFVTKLNPTGSGLVYSTYLGGNDMSDGLEIAVDAAGNAYVTGRTNAANFPTTPGAFQPTIGGGFDAFVTKLNPMGSALIYSTYLGGGEHDKGSGIAVDTAGNAYVTGEATSETSSTNFPTTAGAFQTTGGGFDAFVTKLNPTGSALIYSTFLGGNLGINSRDVGYGIAVDSDGNAYVTGQTWSTDFPTTAGALQTSPGGGSCSASSYDPCPDAFVTKLNPTGSALVYSTYLGGSGDEYSGGGIAVDANGNAYVTGETMSNDFPTTVGAFQPIFTGGPHDDQGRPPGDVFVTKLNPAGTALVYSTYLGGSGADFGTALAVDAGGYAYVVGVTDAIRQSIDPSYCSPCINDFPTTPDSFQPIYGGGSADAFVTKVNPAGSGLVYSTYLGGSDWEVGYGIAVNVPGSAYVIGVTGSTNFPTTTGASQPTYGGGGDAFVAKIVDDTSPPPTTACRFEESAATYTGTWTSYGSARGTFSGGTIFASNDIGATATFSFTGTAVTWIGVKCSLCGIATVSIDGEAPNMVNTAGPASSNFTSEPVFSASGLAPDVSHTMVITVTGVTTSVLAAPFGSHVAVDAFDVTR